MTASRTANMPATCARCDGSVGSPIARYDRWFCNDWRAEAWSQTRLSVPQEIARELAAAVAASGEDGAS